MSVDRVQRQVRRKTSHRRSPVSAVAAPMFPTEDLFPSTQALIRDLMARRVRSRSRRVRDRAPAFSDAEQPALAVFRHLLGRGSEAGILAEVARAGATFARPCRTGAGPTAGTAGVVRIRAAPDHARATAAGRRLPAGGYHRPRCRSGTFPGSTARTAGPGPERRPPARSPRRGPCRAARRLAVAVKTDLGSRIVRAGPSCRPR